MSTRAKRVRNTKPKADALAALSRPTISPLELAALKLLPVSRDGIYNACNSGEIECFRIGGKIVIPCAPLRRKLGIEA